MKNSTFKPKADWKPLKRSAPMAKSSIKMTVTSWLEGGKEKVKKPMKSRAPKMTPIRKSAKGENCTMRLPGICKPEPGNVVWAHSNDSRHGKGGGKKAEDQYGCYACHWCHMTYDGHIPRPASVSEADVDAAFESAMSESRAILTRKKLLD
jgi:hypothetical protein